MPERDSHHTMYQRKVHEIYPVYQSIRENPSMIAHGLARTAHVLLHAETSPIPLLNYYTALRVANRLPKWTRCIRRHRRVLAPCRRIEPASKNQTY